MHSNFRAGFTLVELSIVLVIIGLLTGGVLSGQSLIRAAELKAVTTEFQKYSAATNAFRDKYMALAGDMNNADKFGWVSTAQDGNGNGTLEQAAAISMTAEVFQYWNEMAQAGLIEGSYTGIAGSGNSNPGNDTILGTNAPKSKVTNAGWGVRNLANFPGNGSVYKYDYGNLLVFGGAVTGDWPAGNILKPEEAWNIDTKLDDGKPSSGKVIANNYTTCTTSTVATPAPATDAYKLSDAGLDCSLIFVKPF